MNDCSENEDDPYSSEDELRTKEENKRAVQRRLSTRLSKKPRMVFTDGFSSDEEDYFTIKTPRNRVTPKKLKQSPKVAEPVILNPTIINQNEFKSTTSDFTSGSFVIAKTDAQRYDSSNPPNIWKIDGKVLLQKYEPFTENNELRYKNTSIYTGWSPMECEKYYPIRNIHIFSSSNQKFIISFNMQQIKEMLNNDSD